MHLRDDYLEFSAVGPEADFLVREVARVVLGSLRESPGSSIRVINVNETNENMFVSEIGPAVDIIEDFAATVTAQFLNRYDSLRDALEGFARGLASGQTTGDLSTAGRSALTAILGGVRAVGQGIVVAGTRAENTRIAGNVVNDAVEGIHIGVSHADTPAREAAGRVLIAENTVNSLIPTTYDRSRHAVYVGSAQSVHVIDTIATLRRNGAQIATASPVDGIRVHGRLGPFLSIRQTSLDGFSEGVRVTPLEPIPSARMWVVAETMAASAAHGAIAPGTVVKAFNSP
jgi:hypothetical protein